MATATSSDDEMSIGLPRRQLGRPPQHLLTTLLGDYWLDTERMLPSAALVHLVGEFDVTPVAVRAALARLQRRGLLSSEKRGRNTFYGLTEPARRTLRHGAQRIVSFGRDTEAWDGMWTVVAFSLPETRRNIRHVVRRRLRWFGFAPLYDGLWVSPRAKPEETRDELVALDVDSASVMRATELPAGEELRPLLSAWDLDALRTEYDDFLGEHEPLLDDVRLGRIGAADALLRRTTLMDAYRRFPSLDPELPDSLMPVDWPRQRTTETFVEIYDSLGALAAVRVRQVVAQFADELTPFVQHHTVQQMVHGWPDP